MITCCCSLAGTKACLTCPTYLNDINTPVAVPMPYIAPPSFPFGKMPPGKIEPLPKTKRVIEKYKDGKLIERITEEQ